MKQMEYPVTVEEAVERLIELLPESELQHIRVTGKDELSIFAYPLGFHIQNHFGLLEEGSRLLADCAEREGWVSIKTPEGHLATRYDPDDAAGVIIESLWSRLQEVG